MYRSAKLSDDLTMRWVLERIWNPSERQRICVFILLNPSTGDHESDDPTIIRCCDFAKRWGYDGIRIVNLVSFRSPKPAVMHAWFLKQRLLVLREHAANALAICLSTDTAKVVVGHGVLPVFMRRHAYHTLAAIQNHRNLHAIKLNKDGSPAHPLYLKGDLVPRLYLI